MGAGDQRYLAWASLWTMLIFLPCAALSPLRRPRIRHRPCPAVVGLQCGSRHAGFLGVRASGTAWLVTGADPAVTGDQAPAGVPCPGRTACAGSTAGQPARRVRMKPRSAGPGDSDRGTQTPTTSIGRETFTWGDRISYVAHRLDQVADLIRRLSTWRRRLDRLGHVRAGHRTEQAAVVAGALVQAHLERTELLSNLLGLSGCGSPTAARRIESICFCARIP